MLKIKRNQSVLVALLILTMATMYAFVPVTPVLNAASLSNASDTISDSAPSVAATHDIDFQLSTTLFVDDYVQIHFEDGFTNVSANDAQNICDSADGFVAAASSTGNYIDCIAAGTITSVPNIDITTLAINNPGSEGDYDITVRTFASTSPGTVIDESVLKVYIINGVYVSAKVNSTLTFSVTGVDADEVVNGITTNGTSSPTTIPFGTLDSAASTTVAQQLAVTTNASQGYSVTVEQDGDLESGGSATIDSFASGTPPASPIAWAGPGGTLGQLNEYGHMGLTTNDNDGTLSTFASSKYTGFDGTNPLVVMAHTGPADGSTQSIGLARVAYTVEITDLQEAGDYESNLTYICTPTY